MKGSKDGKKFGPFSFPADAQEAFTLLREAFTNAPILVHFDPALKIKVETDASNFALAGIISQLLANGEWHPVAFWSRKMTPPESRYETHDQELLAIVMVFKHWRHYLEGSYQTIEVLTDHNNLRGFMKVKELNGRQARWAMRLAAFDFVISHRSGKTNPADAPSRRPDYEGVEEVSETMGKLLPTLQRKLATLAAVFSPEFSPMVGRILAGVEKTVRIRDPELGTKPLRSDGETYAQRKCNVAELQLNPVAGTVGCKQLVPRVMVRELSIHETAEENPSQSLQELIQTLQDRNVFVAERRKALEATASKAKRRVSAGKPTLWRVNSKGLLFHGEQIYVPEEESVRAELLKRHHDDVLAGHFGVERTLELIGRKYYWSGMSKDVKDYVSSCDICQRVKAPRHRPYGEMQALPQPERPWQEVTMDFITGLPPSKRRDCVYDAILVVVDRYTKMTRYIPTVKTVTAVQLADLFHEEIVCRFGTPRGVVSDRGSVFTSAFWSDLCYHMKMKRRLSTAFHPQTDGQTERQNQTLEHYIRCYCSDEQDNWASLLPLAEFAYQNGTQTSIGCSPFYAMYGYHPTIHYVEDDSRKGEVPAAKERVKRIHGIREALAQRWENVVATQAKYYDKKHKPQSYRVGDLVMLSTRNLQQKRPNRKLSHKFIGPFRVQDLVGKQAYRLSLPTTYRIHNVFHVSYLEPYQRRRGDGSAPVLQPPELIDDTEEYEVEEIQDKKKTKGEVWYKVKWKGWPAEYDQWVREEDMGGAQELRSTFDAKAQQQKHSKKRKR